MKPDGPIEVVIARRKRTGREHLATVLFLAAYVVAMKVVEDVQTGSWQHSAIRLRLLGVREQIERVRADVRSAAQFQQAVRQTIDRIDEYVPDKQYDHVPDHFDAPEGVES